MVLNTFTVGVSVTPTVVKTYALHYLHRKPRAQKPTAHISYDEGLALIRRFLYYASNHTVEELQAFTSQWVPNPRWVRCKDVEIPNDQITRAAEILIEQLGPKGVEQVGGNLWWQWRRDDEVLQAEWIEMRNHYNHRKKHNEPCKRVMFYVHGGAYFFGSVDEHRYQLQRHARKLQARLLAPRYRLAPQFPFPCGLHDCLAAYLYLLTVQDPSTIILAGDSAGGGMILSLLCVLRDRGICLPAGAILISPWVDLTHSFPSLAGDGKFDYIPAHGFMHKPSISWPPPNEDEVAEFAKSVTGYSNDKVSSSITEKTRDSAADGISDGLKPSELQDKSISQSVEAQTENASASQGTAAPSSRTGPRLSIDVDDTHIVIKDQIQIYTTNQLIDHPLVSPVLQPSLGGLPPLLILTGGGEILKDEQIYLAYKAANPQKFRPSDAYLDKYPEVRHTLDKYRSTDVQLQVWADLCHVTPTLSFTRPAKFMFRSIAQFGAWALAKAQNTGIDILDDDAVSIITSGSDTESEEDPVNSRSDIVSKKTSPLTSIGKAGDPLPRFKNHMIEQLVDRHGNIFPLSESETSVALAAKDIGVIKPGPVKKWIAAKTEWDTKFSKQKAKIRNQRVKEIVKGYHSFGDHETPPPSALAGRRGRSMPKEKKKRSLGLSLWSLWGSSHDKDTLEREANAEKKPETSIVVTDNATVTDRPSLSTTRQESRSRSRHRVVSYEQQADELDSETVALSKKLSDPAPAFTSLDTSNEVANNGEPSSTRNNGLLVLSGTNVTLDSSTATRPKADGIAFPFKLNRSLLPNSNTTDAASMMTLRSEAISLEEEEDPETTKRPGVERFETAHEQL